MNPIKSIIYFISFIWQKFKSINWEMKQDYVSIEWIKEQERKCHH